MANWDILKSAIAGIVKTNSNQEITGQLLQNVLNNIVSSVGENATFAGIATPTTNPGVPDGPVFYLATEAGVYSNFEGASVNRAEVIIFLNKAGKWSQIRTGLASQQQVTELNFDTAVLVFEPQNNTLTKKQIFSPYLKKGHTYRFTFLNKNWNVSGVTTQYNGFSIGYVPQGKEIVDSNYQQVVSVYVPNLSTLKDYYDVNVTGDWEMLNVELRCSEWVYIRVEDITAHKEIEANIRTNREEIDNSIKVLNTKQIELQLATQVLTFLPMNDALYKYRLYKPMLKKGRKLRFTLLNPGWDMSGVTVTGGSIAFGMGYVPLGVPESEWLQNYKAFVQFNISQLENNNQTEFIVEFPEDAEVFNIEVRSSENVYIRVEDITEIETIKSFIGKDAGMELILSTDMSSIANKSNLVNNPFILADNDIIRGKKIIGFRVSVAKAGILSFVLMPNIKQGDEFNEESVTILHSENVGIGVQTIYLPNPITVGENEVLGVSAKSDSALFYYTESKGQGTECPFYYVSAVDNKFYLGERQDLQIGILTLPEKRLAQKKISFFGDSITSFSGVIPSGNAAYYPTGDVTQKWQTWWYKLLRLSGMILEVNQSWSGSRVANPPSGKNEVPFTASSRIDSLGNPDIILVMGGTNDFGQSNPSALGEFLMSDGVKDLDVFKQAYQYLVESLLSKYPKAEIIICSPTLGWSLGLFGKNSKGWSFQDLRQAIQDIANMYGVKYIDMSKCGINNGNRSIYTLDNLHLNEAGMTLMAKYVNRQLTALI